MRGYIKTLAVISVVLLFSASCGGGGDRDVGTVTVRSIVRDANAMGILFDDFFAGNASWADEYQAVLSLGEVVSDNMEICEQLYFGS